MAEENSADSVLKAYTIQSKKSDRTIKEQMIKLFMQNLFMRVKWRTNSFSCTESSSENLRDHV